MEDQFWAILIYMANLRLTPQETKRGKKGMVVSSNLLTQLSFMLRTLVLALL